MKKRMAILLAALSCWVSVIAEDDLPFSSRNLDRAVLRQFATNSVDAFAAAAMPAEQKVAYALALAVPWLDKGNRTKADAYLELAIDLANRNGLRQDECLAHFLSALSADSVRDLPAALAAVTKAEALVKEGGNEELRKKVLAFKGNLQHRRGRYADSLAAYKELLTLCGAPGDGPVKAECLAEIAFLNEKLGKTNDVGFFAEKALALYRKNNDIKGEADCLKILGNRAGGEGRGLAAIDYYGQAAAKYREAGNVHGQANCLYNTGITWRDQGDYGKAVSNLEAAVEAFSRVSSLTGVGIARMELGCTYFKMGDYDKAGSALKSAKSLLSKGQDLCRQAETEAYLADLNEARGERQAALDNRQAAIRLYKLAGLKKRVEAEMVKLARLAPPAPPAGNAGKIGPYRRQ